MQPMHKTLPCLLLIITGRRRSPHSGFVNEGAAVSMSH